MRVGRDMEADLEQQLKEKEGDEEALREHVQVRGSLAFHSSRHEAVCQLVCRLANLPSLLSTPGGRA